MSARSLSLYFFLSSFILSLCLAISWSPKKCFCSCPKEFFCNYPSDIISICCLCNEKTERVNLKLNAPLFFLQLCLNWIVMKWISSCLEWSQGLTKNFLLPWGPYHRMYGFVKNENILSCQRTCKLQCILVI